MNQFSNLETSEKSPNPYVAKFFDSQFSNPKIVKSLNYFEYTCGPHPSAYAHRDQPVPPAPPLQLIQEGRRELGAGATERVAERDRAAVDVQAGGVDREFFQTGENLGGKSLVQLDEIDLIELETDQFEQLPNRRDRSDAESFRLNSGGRKRNESGQRLQATFTR